MTVTTDVAAACIAVSGELDFDTAPLLDEAARILLSGPARHITVDLRGLRFLDAAALGHLVRLRQTLTATGRQLSLRRPSARIVRTFAAGGLDELLESAESRPPGSG